MPETLDMFAGAKKNGAKAEFPEWIDSAIWQEFQQHRREIHAKLTPTATQRMIKHLEKYMALGVNPNEALELSIRNQWRGVFPERLLEKKNGTGKGGTSGTGETAIQARYRRNREAIERADRGEGITPPENYGGYVATDG